MASRRKGADTADNSRRKFLQQVATGGAPTARAALPAVAQQDAQRPAAAAPANQPPIAEALANFAVNLRYEDIPKDVIRTAIRTIIYTPGCALRGHAGGPR